MNRIGKIFRWVLQLSLIFEVLLQGVDLVVEDGDDLLSGDAFEVVQELVDGGYCQIRQPGTDLVGD